MLEEVKRELTKLRQVLGKVAYYSRGAYDGSFLYKKHDVVTYQGSSYVSLKETKGNLPTNEEYWMLLAHKGDKGDTGSQGIQGERGLQGDKGDKGDKGDTYEVTEEDLQNIASQITENANSDFNKNVIEKTEEFNTNVTNKTTDFNSNATSKTTSFNNNYDDKLKAFNDNATTKTNEFNVNVIDKTNTFNTNAETKITGYNSNADNKLEEYNENAVSKVEEFNSNVDSIRHDIDTNTSRIMNIESDLFDSGEAEGESINVKDSTLAEAIRIESEAGWKQDTTKGLNVINLDKSNLEYINVHEYIFENEKLIISSESGSYKSVRISVTELFKENEGKNLNFRYDSLDLSKYTGINNSLIRIRDKDNNMRVLLISDLTKYSYTIPKVEDDDNFTLELLCSGSENTASEVSYNKLIFYLGMDDIDFEKYTGGKPSPSLPYPQDIEVIESGDYGFTTCNKNILPTKWEYWEPGHYNTDGNKSSFATRCRTKNLIPIVPNKEYYVSVSDNKQYLYMIRGYNKDKKFVKDYSFHTTNTNIKLDSDIFFIGVNIGIADTASSDPSVDYEPLFENGTIIPFMTLSSNDKTFENHQESKLLFTIPEGEFFAKLSDTVTDKIIAIYNEDDKHPHLYLQKNVGRTIIDDSYNIVYSTLRDEYYYFQINPNPRMKSNSIIKTNKAIQYSNLYNKSTEGVGFGGTNNNYIDIRVLNTRLSALTSGGAKDFLKSNPILAYYELAEPYVVPLGVADMPLTYYKETNLFNNFPLPVSMKLYYYRDFKGTIEQLQKGWQTAQQDILKLQTDVSTLKEQVSQLMTSATNVIEESEVIEDDLREE